MSFFFSFFFYKIGKQESGTGPAEAWGEVLVGGSRWQGKGA
jgi:hypothetical protein